MSRKITLLLLISFMALNTWAREFPNKPVRIIVGSGADQIARLLAERLSATWGQPVIVENRLSAGGLVAADKIGRAHV